MKRLLFVLAILTVLLTGCKNPYALPWDYKPEPMDPNGRYNPDPDRWTPYDDFVQRRHHAVDSAF